MNLQSTKRILKRLFFLPPIPTLLIAIPSYALVIYALTDETVNPAIAYISYLLSAYAFVISITGITGIVRLVRNGIRQNPLVRKITGIPLVSKYLTEDLFRAKTALYQGFLINLFYAGVKLFSGIYYQSVWFVTLAVYYILLAVMRFSLLHHVRKRAGKNKVSEWRRYRLCGMILLFMNIALTGIVILVVHQNSGFAYPGMLIYIMAMYTFYAVITAVWNVVKFRRYGNPILSAAKVINLTAAMVSMLSLETAMLTQFGAADDAKFRQLMTAFTGAGVCIIVSGMAVYILKLNKLENQNMMPEAEEYDLCRQLCECILQFKEAWDEKELVLETQIEDIAMIRADTNLLELVWNNLISNAIKFTPKGGSVTICQTSEKNRITVAISDTGCGIAKESINHIFDKFYQGDTSHSKEGNGLGLALVKRVLELMNGDIQVISEEGKGSTFMVTLPAADAESHAV